MGWRVGWLLGSCVGCRVGLLVGCAVGCCVGWMVGCDVGLVGAGVATVGLNDGFGVVVDGWLEGCIDGWLVGWPLGRYNNGRMRQVQVEGCRGPQQ